MRSTTTVTQRRQAIRLPPERTESNEWPNIKLNTKRQLNKATFLDLGVYVSLLDFLILTLKHTLDFKYTLN